MSLSPALQLGQSSGRRTVETTRSPGVNPPPPPPPPNCKKAGSARGQNRKRRPRGTRKEPGIEHDYGVEPRQSEHPGKLGAGAELEGRRQAAESRTPEQKRRSRALVELPEEE